MATIGLFDEGCDQNFIGNLEPSLNLGSPLKYILMGSRTVEILMSLRSLYD